ncbi:hypothetical protein J4429_00865 [Candidatus Pacearchaeota archaeon]|nr:hypothetical protein [Candidatus Pacearchaeota archaeon]
MRNYHSLDITHLAKDRKIIEAVLLDRYKPYGGECGSNTVKSGYEFDPINSRRNCWINCKTYFLGC